MFCVVAAKIPTVVTYYGSDLNPDPSVLWVRSAAGRLLSQVAALRVRRIICVSNQLKERLWWRKNRATVIPTGVDTGIFYPRPHDDTRSELGWKKEDRIVLFNAGRSPILKRLSLAQSAVSLAKSICGKIRLEVLDGHVDAHRIPAMMNGADCLLLTSDWEGSPTVVQEALACNLPIVSVDVGDVRERLRRVWPSKIVDRDPNEIGKALAEILMSKDRSNGWYAVQHLSLDKIALHTLAVYQEAIRK
jgi:glycosyltransferase involved in cell wall biosynthesis